MSRVEVRSCSGHYWGEQMGGAWVGGYIVMPGVPGIGNAGHGLDC